MNHVKEFLPLVRGAIYTGTREKLRQFIFVLPRNLFRQTLLNQT
jgi:hypothetical protein